MLSDLDLWRGAQVLVKSYGDGAATEAAMRADEFLDQGNLDDKRCGGVFKSLSNSASRPCVPSALSAFLFMLRS